MVGLTAVAPAHHFCPPSAVDMGRLNSVAASSCIPGTTWEWISILAPIVACPRRSWTIFGRTHWPPTFVRCAARLSGSRLGPPSFRTWRPSGSAC